MNGKYFRQKLYRCTTRKQLQRLREEIQITCKYNNIEIPLNIRRSKYHHYIEHLSKMIDTSNAKQSSFLLSNFRTLLINEDYKAMINNSETDEMTKKFIQQTLKFEEELFNLSFKQCYICHQRRLNMKTNNGVCTKCQSKKNEIYFAPNNKVLPTWKTKNNVIKYTLPSELQNLTIVEKLLIQRVSPLVPIIHINNGVLGTRGHVVSFFQDISGICTELPKIPSEVTMVKIIRTGTTAEGENIKDVFTVNRLRILNALK